MSDPKTPAEILEALGKPFPKEAVERRQGAGNRSYDYVAAETVIRRLNSATNGEWSFVMRGYEWRGELLMVHGELSIPGLGTRSGFGVQKVAANAGEDLIKGAASDALKKCATQFGVALELYGPDLEAGEIAEPPAQRRPQAQRPPQRAQKPRDTPQQPAPTPDASTTHDAAWSAANTALHLAARQHNVSPADIETFFHEKGIAAPTTLQLGKLTDLIESKADTPAVDAFAAWLSKRRAQQAALMPGPDVVPNPDRFTR